MVLLKYNFVHWWHHEVGYTVSSLQLLHVCETELAWLDISINVNKSSCLRVGPRCSRPCSNLTTLDGQEIMWTNKVRYLGVYLVSSKALSCDCDLSNSLSVVHLMRSIQKGWKTSIARCCDWTV